MTKGLSDRLQAYLADESAKPVQTEPVISGTLTRMVGLTLEAIGLAVEIGSRCVVEVANGKRIELEVVGFDREKTFLMPIYAIDSLRPGARVTPISAAQAMPIGPELLGRVINGVGDPLDGLGPLRGSDTLNEFPVAINPLARRPIREPLDVGVRSINALMTVGKGQRMGLFAGSGVGKSVLLGMMTRFTKAQIVVVGLIGERGREVKEFIDDILGTEGLKRAIVVASPADDAPLMRLRAAMLASRIAEHFRDLGFDVLLLMDSLTRYAQAQREISLAIGEPPASKGYPPSVFAKLPALVERAGNGATNAGSVTAFYTVLTEGDDLQDPVADSARAILDGHIVLSRSLAEEGLYPAIDVESSISRAMPMIVEETELQSAQRFKQYYARYQQNRDLVNVGAYVSGSDPDTDFALERMPLFREFLRQSLSESVTIEKSQLQLNQILQANVES